MAIILPDARPAIDVIHTAPADGAWSKLTDPPVRASWR
jgi:hypothetical protein